MKRRVLMIMGILALLGYCSSGNDSGYISGTAKYEFPTFSAGTGLALNSPTIETRPIRNAVVEVVHPSSEAVLGEGATDGSGNFNVAYEFKDISKVKVRVLARIGNSDALPSTSDVLLNVADNTSNGAIYALTTEAQVKKGDVSTVALLASVSNSDSGPFSILDMALDCFKAVKAAAPGTRFAKLNIFWSTKNVATTFISVSTGQIPGSVWDGSQIWLLGKAGVDADEYDIPVVAHEFGHYVETTLGKSHSIGGAHSIGNRLDPRVAFSEGFGNAFSSMVRNNPVYYDTSGANNATVGLNLNLESDATTNAGSHNETSIQKIMWDLYDSNNDGSDALALGFNTIYGVMVNQQKNTHSLTTILPFIKAIKSVSGQAVSVDAIVNKEFGGTINDDFCTGGTCGAAGQPDDGANNCRPNIYNTSLAIGGSHVQSATVGIDMDFGGQGFNKYCSTEYYKITGNGTTHNIQFQAMGATCDLDLYVYENGVLKSKANSKGENAGGSGLEVLNNFTFTNGATYIIEIRGWSKNSGGNQNQQGNGATGVCSYTIAIP